jgi:ParB-like chromosome segregation protein Spo0J
MTSLRFLPEQIEQWPMARLKPYAQNARTHSDDQVAKIAASLVEYGWTAPVMVSDDGEIVAGHGRLLAAQHLGLNEVPIIRLSLTPEQVRAYRIADNRLSELSGWDDELLAAELHALNAAGFDLALTGFEGEDLDRLLAPLDAGDGLANEDVIPEPPVNPVSRPGDLWLLGDHRLLCGDSTKADNVIRVMHNQKAILFSTDPPYLVDYDGTNHPSKQSWPDKNKDWGDTYGVTWDDSSQGPELYEGFIKAAIEHAILPNAAWYCWHASRRQAMVEGVWEKFGAFVHQQIVWAKDRGILTRSYYLWQHEPCFFGWPG